MKISTHFEFGSLSLLSTVLILVTNTVNGCELSHVRRKRATDNEDEHDKHQWNYASFGPSKWYNQYKECGGSRQSPIDIDTARVMSGSFPPFRFVNYDVVFDNMTIFNNGHTVQVNVNDSNNQPYIYGGGLTANYELIQFHFHWSFNDKEGSENTINGVQYPLELHLVHKKEGLSSDDLLRDPKGLAVLGVMFQLPEDNHKQLPSYVTSALQNVDTAGDTFNFDGLRFKHLLPVDTDSFFRYDGSLTTPPCAESVIWTVFREPNWITKEQMSLFRQIKNVNNEVIQHNWRPVQSLNGRTVLYHSRNGEMAFGDRSPGKRGDDSYTGTLIVAFGIVIIVLLIVLIAVGIMLYKKRGSQASVIEMKNDAVPSSAWNTGRGSKEHY